MNREIKFRAWSKSENKMYYRVLVGNTLTDDPCSSVWKPYNLSLAETMQRQQYNGNLGLGEWVNFDKYCGVIMQYTGLKDKNDNPIFEGDILNHKYIVSWGELGSYVLDTRNPDTETNFSFIDIFGRNLVDYEITSNIYENPELLKEVIK